MNFLVTDEINVRRSQWDVGSTEKETNGGKDKKQIKKKEVGCLVPRGTEVFSPPVITYRFQPLHCILADVHASGLLHLHMSQVLQGRDTEGERE